MTATYENHNLKFMYPENWVLRESNETQDFVEISLESPENSIWSVGVFGLDATPADLLDSSVAALREQYEDLEVAEVEVEIAGYRAEGIEANFYCLDFLVTAQAHAFVVGQRTFHFFCQAESRDFDKNRPIFEAIAVSLLNNI